MSGEVGQLLIIARHYPPNVSGGSRRPYLLAHGLRRLGWRVFVASPNAPIDEPDWIKVDHPAATRAADNDGEGTTSKTDWKAPLRRMVYWPDNDIRWARRAANISAARCRPDWVLTTSPPESSHLAGRLIKQATGARWLAEFRDNWIEEPLRDELRDSMIRRVVERRIARNILSIADHIVAASDQIAAEVAKYAPNSPAMVIGHFAKPASWRFEFEGPGPHLLHTGQFTLSHPERFLKPVLDAFQTARSKLPGTTRLHLAGRLTREERAIASDHPEAAAIKLYGAVEYETALAMQAGAHALILTQPNIDALPGKFGEYLLTGKLILTVGEGPWLSRINRDLRMQLSDYEIALTPTETSVSAVKEFEISTYDSILRSSLMLSE